MTNEIGTGTVNFSWNMPMDERSFWGRLAGELSARSLSDLYRALTLRALEEVAPAKAIELKNIRTRYYGKVLFGMFILFVVLGCVGAAGADWAVRLSGMTTNTCSTNVPTMLVYASFSRPPDLSFQSVIETNETILFGVSHRFLKLWNGGAEEPFPRVSENMHMFDVVSNYQAVLLFNGKTNVVTLESKRIGTLETMTREVIVATTNSVSVTTFKAEGAK